MSDPILLVEDDNADAMLIERAIRRAGITYPVRRVGDGDAAVDYLSGLSPYKDREQHPLPVLILLDLKLPRRSGFEVLSWLRAQNTGVQRLPVVVLTSSSHSQDVNRAYDLGANSYLVKPSGPDALLDMIQKLDTYWLTMNRSPELA